jgi:hypothetical protein
VIPQGQISSSVVTEFFRFCSTAIGASLIHRQ